MNDVGSDNGIIELVSAKNREDEHQQSRFVQKIGESEFVECEAPEGYVSERSNSEVPIHRIWRVLLHIEGAFTRDIAIAEVNRQGISAGVRTVDRAIAKLRDAGLLVGGDKYGTYVSNG